MNRLVVYGIVEEYSCDARIRRHVRRISIVWPSSSKRRKKIGERCGCLWFIRADLVIIYVIILRATARLSLFVTKFIHLLSVRRM